MTDTTKDTGSTRIEHAMDTAQSACNGLLYASYLKLLKYLCKKEIRRISITYPISREELIRYHDFLAIECLGSNKPSAERILGVCISTSRELER